MSNMRAPRRTSQRNIEYMDYLNKLASKSSSQNIYHFPEPGTDLVEYDTPFDETEVIEAWITHYNAIRLSTPVTTADSIQTTNEPAVNLIDLSCEIDSISAQAQKMYIEGIETELTSEPTAIFSDPIDILVYCNDVKTKGKNSYSQENVKRYTYEEMMKICAATNNSSELGLLSGRIVSAYNDFVRINNSNERTDSGTSPQPVCRPVREPRPPLKNQKGFFTDPFLLDNNNLQL